MARGKNAAKEACSSEGLQERVQQKSYELWQKRGSAHGNDWADWFEAEKTIKANK